MMKKLKKLMFVVFICTIVTIISNYIAIRILIKLGGIEILWK